jgi:AcrR family transcriptional regulator
LTVSAIRYTLYTMTSESTKTRLFQAARALFDEEGEAGLSMRRIAAAVGMTPMAIYKHYADKDALVNALMLDGFDAWEARATRIAETDPAAWLRALAIAFLDFALTEPRRYEAAFLLRASQARRYPDDFAAGRSPVVHLARRHAERLRARGRGGPTAGDVVLALSALCQGLVDMYRAGRFTREDEFRTAYLRAVDHCIRSYTPETQP